MVHKLYCDSRARKEGDHASWTWQPDRPIFVPKTRAFIDSVHLPVAWKTIGSGNRYLFVTETLSLLPVILAVSDKVYVKENGSPRVLTIPAAVYDGPGFATALQNQLGAGWSVTFNSGPGLGSLSVTGPAPWHIYSRRELIANASLFGANPASLNDACDLLGVRDAGVSGNPTGTLNLSPALNYRRVALTEGFYTATSLATMIAARLAVGTVMAGTWSATYSDLTGRITIANDEVGRVFQIWPETYLERNPYLWPGIGSDFQAADGVTGFEGDAPMSGNTVMAPMHVNVMRYHTIFISSSLGSHNDSVGPVSQSTIARKVVLSEARGGMIDDHHSLPYDFIALEPQSINAITFRLTDWKGRTVPMDVPWSLSIILVEEQEF